MRLNTKINEEASGEGLFFTGYLDFLYVHCLLGDEFL